jgi:hypothetical protein
MIGTMLPDPPTAIRPERGTAMLASECRPPLNRGEVVLVSFGTKNMHRQNARITEALATQASKTNLCIIKDVIQVPHITSLNQVRLEPKEVSRRPQRLVRCRIDRGIWAHTKGSRGEDSQWAVMGKPIDIPGILRIQHLDSSTSSGPNRVADLGSSDKAIQLPPSPLRSLRYRITNSLLII